MREFVYDILDCGPRHRFWANGKLVHNSNFQNLKRKDKDSPNEGSPLRKAILAPSNYLLGAVDLSQVECRVLNYLANQTDVVERFRRGEDPYIVGASLFYGRPITKADANERGTGKQLELSCGFGCGAVKFQATAKLGIYGPPVHMSLDDAQRAVDVYRKTHPAVIDYWRLGDKVLQYLAGGMEMAWGPMKITNHKIILPNGIPLHYDTLEWQQPRPTVEELAGKSSTEVWKMQQPYWRLRSRQGWIKYWGGVIVENAVQALSRVIMSQAMLRIMRKGYRVVNTTHDELLLIIPKDGREEQHLELCLAEMKREPTWLPGIVLDAEGSMGERYSK